MKIGPDDRAFLRAAASTGTGMLVLSVASMNHRTWPSPLVAALVVLAIAAVFLPVASEILRRESRRVGWSRVQSLRGWMILERSDALDAANDPATAGADRVVALARADALLDACRQAYTTFGDEPPADLATRRRIPSRRRP